MSARHPIERAVFAASVAALLTLVGLLVYDGLARTSEPRLTIALAAAERQGSGWVLPFAVHNDGGSAAMNVDVEVARLADDQLVESGTVTLPFVPQGSRVEAIVTFTEEPTPEATEARVLGYELP